MYLWIVLATFIVALYSFNLSVRTDLDRAYAETKASVVITKFRALHNGVAGYCNSQAPSKTGQDFVTYYPGFGVNSTTMAGAADGSGSPTVENILGYLPVGYAKPGDAIEDIANIPGGGEIVSKVFCFLQGDTTKQCDQDAEGNVIPGEGSCCNNRCLEDGGCSGIYVVSFAQMPSRWINKETLAPNADMKMAIAKVRGYGKNFGYIDEVNGQLVLSGGSVKQNQSTTGTPDTDETQTGTESGETPAADETQTGTESGETPAAGGDTPSVNNKNHFVIWDAVQDDADFRDMGCNDADRHCLFAVQQIYG